MAQSRRQMFAAKKLRAQYASQLEEERNGAPTPPDIAVLMTQPKTHDTLYQVHVDVKGEQEPWRIGPKIGHDAAEMILETVNKQICLGKLPKWGNARLEPCMV